MKRLGELDAASYLPVSTGLYWLLWKSPKLALFGLHSGISTFARHRYILRTCVGWTLVPWINGG